MIKVAKGSLFSKTVTLITSAYSIQTNIYEVNSIFK
jgi:hypothetical protein